MTDSPIAPAVAMPRGNVFLVFALAFGSGYVFGSDLAA